MDKKGKGKMDPANDIEYPYFSSTPSFDLGIDSTPIIPNVVSMDETFKSKEVQQQVDVVITCVVKETVVEEQVGGSPHSAPTSGLLIKRALRPTWILRFPYVTDAGKQSKYSDGVIVFDKSQA
ncbi:Hypothetical predicted protein [Olea europaea subsp. europaea]|uniref:Uncharacterized protein n=1 Tax=Olea europaea subsp. europaea TaxID=158383 RepID=A0A8S0QTY8_OLEEU|nr:Hypothetical predicted protein [Olea europaea subsp. europaea]